MALIKFTFLVFFVLQSSAVARVVEVGGAQTEWDNLMVRGDSCKDCTQIFELVVDLLSNADLQKMLTDRLEELCERLPAPGPAKLCHSQVENFLPLALTFLTGAINPGQACIILGICNSKSNVNYDELLMSQIQQHLKAAMITLKIPSSTQCTLCIYLIKTLESLLPTEVAVEEVCDLLPSLIRGRCQSLLKTLLDRLLSSVTPQDVCTFIRVCDGPEDTGILQGAPQPYCDSCLAIAVLSRLKLGSNASELQSSSFMGSVCQLYPTVFPKCADFTHQYWHQLKGVLGKQEAALDLCHHVGLCVRARSEISRNGDPCTLTSYRCRDLKTALECGTVAFCQKLVW